MANTTNREPPADRLEILLEAARRANWDAQRGPPHLRTGRFRPSLPDPHTPEQPTAAAAESPPPVETAETPPPA